ncbi:MAG: CcoQ/FixQ family Cbb3-type cytochrome c oxidase assembly chaperone [Bacteroidia bacterium]|jgi:cytochrome c oxidase cbb3-type subunit 3|nr:CcoQ/FixQ family Cbb3-type cytochrome c oxidase assembly chaperone [Bacteroidia bacterium]
MKFINYLQSISGVGIFPLISLLMFFVFFAAVTWYVFRVDKTYIERASRIPMNEEPTTEV